MLLETWLSLPNRAAKVTSAEYDVGATHILHYSVTVAWRDSGGDWLYAHASGVSIQDAFDNCLSDPFAAVPRL